MRKNLEVVNKFSDVYLDFVAIPAKNEQHKKELLAQQNEVFEDIILESDQD